MLKDLSEKVAPKKLVILFDEVDVITGPSMVSFLRQLRDGFTGRSVGKFPVSVALVGMRDLRDYLVNTKDGMSVNPGSPFNIKESSYTLKNFSFEEVKELLSQHTEDHIEDTKERLIKSRAVHIDSLTERLKDPRIKRVIQPILA